MNMIIRLRAVTVITLVFFLGPCMGLAQSSANGGREPADSQPQNVVVSVPAGNPLAEAAKLRSDLAATVVNGAAGPASILARLRVENSPTGLRLEADAEFAFASNDIGRRLVAAGRLVSAKIFFEETEKALTTLIQRTPDTSAQVKAQYLSARADIRARYLQAAGAARTDIDGAIQLQPDNPELKQLRAALGKERPEFFKDTPKS